MRSLTIGADPAMRLVFGAPSYADDGQLESYEAKLVAANFHASVRVSNPDFGLPPTQFFQAIAQSWRGWHGVKSWSSMEGEFEIDATSDRIGHIELLVRIPEHGSDGLWSTKSKVLIEAGQAESVALDVEAFFARRDV